MGMNCAIFHCRKPSSFRKFFIYFGLVLASVMPVSLRGHLAVIDSIYTGRAEQLAIAPNPHKLYAAYLDSGVIYVIDTQNDTVIDSLQFSHRIGFLATDPAQNWLFITVRRGNSGTAYDLYKIDCITDAILDHSYQIDFNGGQFCMDSSGYLYIHYLHYYFGNALLKVSETDLTLLDTVFAGYAVSAVAADRTIPNIYASLTHVNAIQVLDTEIGGPVKALAVWRDPVSMCGCGLPILYVVHHESDTISVVDMQSLQTKRLITLKGNADHIACNSGLNRAYAAMHDVKKIAVIDGYTYEVIEYINLNGEPSWIAVDETTNRLYVSCPDDGKIYVLEDTP